MSKRDDILQLAASIERASVVEVHSGDREPGARVTDQGRKWIVDGLKLLAAKIRD